MMPRSSAPPGTRRDLSVDLLRRCREDSCDKILQIIAFR
jgi:hypothetical protein